VLSGAPTTLVVAAGIILRGTSEPNDLHIILGISHAAEDLNACTILIRATVLVDLAPTCIKAVVRRRLRIRQLSGTCA
jgi:hypothetical protein